MYTRSFLCAVAWWSDIILITTILLNGVSCAVEVTTLPQIWGFPGENVELPCATDASDATVYWYYGDTTETATRLVANVFRGQSLPRRENVRMTTDFTLHLSNVSVADSGAYVCVVSPSPLQGVTKTSSTLLNVTERDTTPTNGPSFQLSTPSPTSVRNTLESSSTPPNVTTQETRTSISTTSQQENFFDVIQPKEHVATTQDTLRKYNRTTGITTAAATLESYNEDIQVLVKVSSTAHLVKTGGYVREKGESKNQKGHGSSDTIVVVCSVAGGVTLFCLLAALSFGFWRHRNRPKETGTGHMASKGGQKYDLKAPGEDIDDVDDEADVLV